MNVVFVEPFFPSSQRQFARALAAAGAAVIGIGEYPADALDGQLKDWLYHYELVPSVTDVEAMTAAVRSVQDRVWVDRLDATIEAHTLPAAQVREACTIPGTSVRTAYLCRDKPSMKEALREAGVPTAASAAVSSADEVHAFAEQTGYPLILKPRSGAGALDTARVDDPAGLDRSHGMLMHHEVAHRLNGNVGSQQPETDRDALLCSPVGGLGYRACSGEPPYHDDAGQSLDRAAQWVRATEPAVIPAMKPMVPSAVIQASDAQASQRAYRP